MKKFLTVILAMMIIISLSSCNSTTSVKKENDNDGKVIIDCKDLYTIFFNGYSGSGTATLSMTGENEDKNVSLIFGDITEMQDIQTVFLNYSKYEAMLDEFSGTIDKTENLSNGDIITVTISPSVERAKNLNVKFINTTYTIEVKELTEKTEYTLDPYIKDIKSVKLRHHSSLLGKVYMYFPILDMTNINNDFQDYSIYSEIFVNEHYTTPLEAGDKIEYFINWGDKDRGSFIQTLSSDNTKVIKEEKFKTYYGTYILTEEDISQMEVDEINSYTESLKSHYKYQ